MKITAAVLVSLLSAPLDAAGFAEPVDLFTVDFSALEGRAARQPSPRSGPVFGPSDSAPRVRSLSGSFRSPAGFAQSLNAVDDYRIGDEFGKKPVTAGGVGSGSPVFQRTAKATAHYGGGTAFYLGKFNGHHLMATNHHVAEGVCRGSARFPLLQKSYPCERVYSDWEEVDVDFFSITVPAADEDALEPLGRNFAFDAPIYTGQELLTVGFGIAGNPARALMANQDSDCKVFSATNEFRLIMDPDQFNPGGYAAWSFVNGCDVSHGDSGSSFVDRNTGEVLGIIWTGKIPKIPAIRDSAHLDEMLRTSSPEIWTELSFCVPAVKIRERIEQELRARPGGGDWSRTMSAIIARPATLSSR